MTNLTYAQKYNQRHKPWLKWYREHKEAELERGKLRRGQDRLDAFVRYSLTEIPQCVRCGVDDIDVLCIDHINGNGNEHRKGIRNHLYWWLKQQNYPEGFQVLCRNCNWKKRIKGD